MIMNSNFPHQFAAQLKANPSFFEDIDEALLCDMVFNHAQGLLSEDDAAEVETLLRTNAKAQEIRERLHDADRFMATENGRAALNDLLDRALPAKTDRRIQFVRE